MECVGDLLLGKLSLLHSDPPFRIEILALSVDQDLVLEQQDERRPVRCAQQHPYYEDFAIGAL